MIRKLRNKNRAKRVGTALLVCYLLFSVCLTLPGTRLPSINARKDSTPQSDDTPLSVEVDVGSVHFRGEKAEFFILTTFKGSPVTVTDLKASLYKPNETSENLKTETQKITTGFYKIGYEIPLNAPAGTYSLLVEARYKTKSVDSQGGSFKSFLLSPTLTLWNELYIPMLTSVDENIGTILTEIGYIQVDLTAINAIIVDINEDVATIQTDIGDIITTLDFFKLLLRDTNAMLVDVSREVTILTVNATTILLKMDALNATIVAFSDNIVLMNTSIGYVEADVDIIRFLLEDINATVLGLNRGIATIQTTIGDVKIDLKAINTTMLSIKEKTNGYTLELNSSLGRLHLVLDNITQFMIDTNSTLLGIQGDIYIIRTDLGDIQTDIQDIKDLFDQQPSVFPWSNLLIVAVVCIVAVALYRIFKPFGPPKSAFPSRR